MAPCRRRQSPGPLLAFHGARGPCETRGRRLPSAFGGVKPSGRSRRRSRKGASFGWGKRPGIPWNSLSPMNDDDDDDDDDDADGAGDDVDIDDDDDDDDGDDGDDGGDGDDDDGDGGGDGDGDGDGGGDDGDGGVMMMMMMMMMLMMMMVMMAQIVDPWARMLTCM